MFGLYSKHDDFLVAQNMIRWFQLPVAHLFCYNYPSASYHTPTYRTWNWYCILVLSNIFYYTVQCTSIYLKKYIYYDNFLSIFCTVLWNVVNSRQQFTFLCIGEKKWIKRNRYQVRILWIFIKLFFFLNIIREMYPFYVHKAVGSEKAN